MCCSTMDMEKVLFVDLGFLLPIHVLPMQGEGGGDAGGLCFTQKEKEKSIFLFLCG